MANFFKNLVKKVGSVAKGVVKGVVKVAGNVGGTLIGVPGLGTAAAGLIDKIPFMASKAVDAGHVDTAKVKETVIAHAPDATPAVHEAATLALTKEIQNQIHADDTNSYTAANAIPVTTTALSTMSKLKLAAENYWFVSIPVLGYALYYIVKRFIFKK